MCGSATTVTVILALLAYGALTVWGEEEEEEMGSGVLRFKDEMASGAPRFKDEVASGAPRFKDEMASGAPRFKEEMAGGAPRLKDEVAGGAPRLKDEVTGGAPRLKEEAAGGAPSLKDEVAGGLPRFVEEVPNITVTVGREALLPCTVEHLRGFKVAWVQVDTQTILTIHKQVITRNPRINLLHNDHRTWHLQLTNVREKDRGWYMCQVNTDPMRYRQGYVDVVVPPDIIDRESSGDITVREGEDVTLTCRAKGHPTPSVIWRREDNQHIVLDEDLTVPMVEGDTLLMAKVSRMQMGSYLCIASNGVPPSISKRTQLNVQFPPVAWVPQQLEGASLGQELVLECHTEAFPRSINYWTNPKGDLIVAGTQYEPELVVKNSYVVFMRLRIRHLRQEDLGTFRCVAKNSLGEIDGAIRVYKTERLQFQTTPGLGPRKEGTAFNYTQRIRITYIKGQEKFDNFLGPKRINDVSDHFHHGKPKGKDAANHDTADDHHGPAGRSSEARATIPDPLLLVFFLTLVCRHITI
ncbi:lachesin-like isoform X2 [Panulirus ornatus]|uniref:lachesin-like isoform X2 n=1 Tax=Panulirus ornatus TaxID=150431 RepID=UPI003A896716